MEPNFDTYPNGFLKEKRVFLKKRVFKNPNFDTYPKGFQMEACAKGPGRRMQVSELGPAPAVSLVALSFRV